MAILRPFILPTAGAPSTAVLPRRGKNLTQEDFYKQQQDAGSPVDQHIQPQQNQFANDPQSGQYVAGQLQNYANRKAPPSLEPGSRVKAADASTTSPDNFKAYYDMLGTIGQIGTQATAAESARAAYRRQAQLNAANSMGGGGGSGIAATPTGQYTGQYGKGVDQWRDTALQAMHMLGIPDSYLSAVLRRMKQESGGNPNIQNNWDSNAKKGTPSIGLMQTIGPTFNSYAGSLRGRGITDPLANIYAGLNYAGSRYGKAHGGFLGGVLYAMNKPGGY